MIFLAASIGQGLEILEFRSFADADGCIAAAAPIYRAIPS